MDETTLAKQSEELYLLTCSLLGGESVLFTHDGYEDKEWEAVVQAFAGLNDHRERIQTPMHPACLQLRVEGLAVWFEVVVPMAYGSADTVHIPSVSVKCDQWTRREQERWRETVDTLLSTADITTSQ